MARVLVTGANGFAGAAICRRLLARGWAVRGAVRRPDAALPASVERTVSGPPDTVSNAAIVAALGWSPAYTLDEGLALTCREAF